MVAAVARRFGHNPSAQMPMSHPFSNTLAILLVTMGLGAQSPTRVRGVVVDEHDRPLVGVAVCPFSTATPCLTAELAAHPATRTGADGTFELTFDPTARPVCDAAVFLAEGRVHVAAGLGYVDMTPVILPPGRALAGTVRDGKGQPVAGVRVEARDWLVQSGLFGLAGGYAWSTGPEPRGAARTDASGRFVIDGMCETAMWVRGGGDGFTFAESGPLAADASFDLVVERSPVVAVHVVDEHGAPVAGALTIAAPLMNSSGAGRQGGITDSAGAWRFTWPDDGALSVSAYDGDGRSASLTLEEPVETVDLRLVPPPAATKKADPAPGTVEVRGRVLDPDGDRPIADAWVKVVSRGMAENDLEHFVLDDNARQQATVRTGKDGTFVLHVEPGRHALVAAEHAPQAFMGRHRNPTPLPIEVEAGSPCGPFDLKLQPVCVARGTVGPTPLPRGCLVCFCPVRRSYASGEELDFQMRAPIAGDGSVALPGALLRDDPARIVVPRGFREGLPDKLLLGTVRVSADTPLRLSAADALPGTVHGIVQSPVPFERLAVMSLGANRPDEQYATNYGCRWYTGPVTPVQRDGSYRLHEPGGERALLVVDLWSGIVLHKTALANAAARGDREGNLDVAALPLDVVVKKLPPHCAPWLDLVPSPKNWPAGLGHMVGLGNDRDNCGLGVAVPRDGKPFRLWLPAGKTRLVLRTAHAILADGSDKLADVFVDAADQHTVTLEAVAKQPGDGAHR